VSFTFTHPPTGFMTYISLSDIYASLAVLGQKKQGAESFNHPPSHKATVRQAERHKTHEILKGRYLGQRGRKAFLAHPPTGFMTYISLSDIYASLAGFEDAVDPGGEEVPLFDPALELGPPFGRDGVGFSFAALADGFPATFQPAVAFHLREVRVEPAVGGLENLTGLVCEFLPDEIAMQGAVLLQQRENEHFDMPLYHLTIQTLFHGTHISLSDICTQA